MGTRYWGSGAAALQQDRWWLKGPTDDSQVHAECSHSCLTGDLQADRFVRTGKTLRRQMWWQNCKMKLVIAFVVILLAVVVFLLVCFRWVPG
jgi:hypothetical protein